MKLGRSIRRCAVLASVCSAYPALAQVAAPPLEAYGELPTLEDMALSDSGKLTMLTTSEGKRVLLVLNPDMKPVSAIEVGDIKVRDISWIGDDLIMVERSDTMDLGERFIAQNMEFFNAMIVPIDPADEIRTVFADDKSTLNAFFGTHGFREIDGKWVGFFSGWPMQMGQRSQYYFAGGSPTLYSVDMASNKSRRLMSAPLRDETADWLIDAKGNVVATMNFNHRSGAWSIVDGRGRQLAAGSEPEGSGAISSFTRDGTGVLYRITPEHGDGRLFEVPLTGGTPPTPVFENVDIETLFFDRASRLIGYLPEDTDEGPGEPHFFDEAVQSRIGKVITSFRSANGSLRGWTPDFGRVLISTSGNNDSGTWYLVDTDKGQANVIGRSRPLIRPNQVGPVRTIKYAAEDGLEIEAILTVPPGRESKNLPVIVLPHGGPRSHDTLTFDFWAQAFASRGYAVLQPNFRGSTGYGDEFLHAGDGQWGRKMQSDLSDGLAHLAAQGIVDPKRACIVGASYGGYAALAAVTLQNGIYRCSVSIAGVSDLEMSVNQDYNETGSKDLRDYWLELMGPREELGKYSPRKNAARASAPILLMHGKDDTVVPYRQSRAMADALKDAGKPFELIEMEGEDHWMSRSQTRKQMLTAAVDFVEKHNPPN